MFSCFMKINRFGRIKYFIEHKPAWVISLLDKIKPDITRFLNSSHMVPYCSIDKTVDSFGFDMNINTSYYHW